MRVVVYTTRYYAFYTPISLHSLHSSNHCLLTAAVLGVHTSQLLRPDWFIIKISVYRNRSPKTTSVHISTPTKTCKPLPSRPNISMKCNIDCNNNALIRSCKRLPFIHPQKHYLAHICTCQIDIKNLKK